MSEKHEKVVFGKEDFLFLGGEDANAIDQFLTGKQKISQAAMTVWQENTRCRRALLPSIRGVIIPEAHVIYPDKLPDGFNIAARRPVHDVLDIAGEQFVYPLAFLLEARRAGSVIYTGHDSHWTEQAALETWLRLIRPTLGRTGPFRTAYQPSLDHEYYDLRTKVVPKEEVDTRWRRTFAPVDGRLILSNNISNKGSLQLFQSPSAESGRLLVFGTSFIAALAPFLIADFQETMVVYSTSVDWSLIRLWKPDQVLMEMPERFIHAPAVDSDACATFLCMLSRAARQGESKECFSFGVREEISPESAAIVELHDCLDNWVGRLLSTGYPPALGALEQFGIGREMVDLALLVRAYPALLRIVAGLSRHDGALQTAFDLVDRGAIREEHLPFLSDSEMAGLIKIRVLCHVNKFDAATRELANHVKRFALSAEAGWYAQYLGFSLKTSDMNRPER